MCEIQVGSVAVDTPAPATPQVGGGTWKLACKLGVLYSFGKGGNPRKIKQAAESMDPIPLSKVGGGCSMKGIKNLWFVAKRVPTGGSISFLITISDETRPEFSFQILIHSSVLIELSWDGDVIKSEVLGRLDDLLATKPGKLKTIPPAEVRRARGPLAAYFTHKHIPFGESHASHCSLTLFNDGKNLYSKSNEIMNQLFFQMYRNEVPANSVPGAQFLESTIMFKTFGHTIDGSVIVMVREKFNNWCLTISIGRGKTIALYDNHRTVSVVKV